MKKPDKTDSANCFCDVYVAIAMDAYLVEKDENINFLKMANKNGNYTLADKCDEFNKYAEKTEKRIERLRVALKEMINMCKNCGDFSNGVEMFGIDERIVKSTEIIKSAEQTIIETEE